MKWTKITIETVTSAVDMISYTLGELGVGGIEVEDKIPLTEEEKRAMYIDILPELPPDDGLALVSCYVDPESNLGSQGDILARIEEELTSMRDYMEIGSGRTWVSEVEDKDWLNNWKAYFHAFRVGDLLIKPTWIPLTEVEDYKSGEDYLEIDPGTAFGTGAHETTKLCIAQLQTLFHTHNSNASGDEKCDIGFLNPSEVRVLDAGCGSGILSILSAKYGASQVLGVDIDPKAVEISIENSEINHINQSKVEYRVCNLLEEEPALEPVDLVVANILADVIIPLTGRVGKYLKNGGYYVVSGIIDTKETAVREALLSEGYKIVNVSRLKEWVSFTAVKLGD